MTEHDPDGALGGDPDSVLTFETLFTDPMIRLVMARDGVTARDMVDALEVARASVARRERAAAEGAAPVPAAG